MMDNKIDQTLIQLNEDLTVLYVEDSDIVRESTYDMMKEFFAHVDVAVDGVDGLQKYKEFHEEHHEYYDIVFTDINMPKMNGINMSEAILIENTMQNIVVISAHNESDYLLKLINMGISNFILKPIEIMQFQSVVSRLTYAILNEKMLKLKQKELLKINHLLQSAKKEAEEASLQKSRFLANMSHEIRTPLNAITGFISLLNEKETDLNKLKYLKVIRNSSDLLLQIINDILDFSKIESGKMELNSVNFCPYEDLIITGELFQARASEEHILLKINYNNTMPKILYGDIIKIKQIFSNLLSNAIKFTPQNSVVKCVIWYSKGQLNIRVKDYGIGIPKKKQRLIFESFTQAENSTVREYGGTGLGLAISKRLTKILGGTLALDSEEGKGSTFQLSIPLPLGEEKKEEEEKEELSNIVHPLDGHILIVEDNETNSMFIGIILDNIGITYEIAHNGIEAVEKFQEGNYSLILMDENMPKLSGIGATKAILEIEKQQNLRHTPIISLTANAFSGDRERFLEAGMDDYISKPVEPRKLLQLIQKFI
jgi:signal transduction histidine kinase